jgi:hypothetical protein
MAMFCLVLTTLSSCKDEIIVGGGLLDDEKILIDYTDTIGLISETVISEPIVVYDTANTSRRTYIIGQMKDSEFGTFTSHLALGFNINNSSPPSYPIGEKPLKFDSIVLVLTLDTLGTYGNLTNIPFHFQVYQLAKPLPIGRTIKSDISLDISNNVLADVMKSVKPKDSTSIVNHADGKVIKLMPQIRIKLNDEFGKLIFDDKEAALKDSAFVALVNGIYLTAIPMNQFGTFGVNFSTSAMFSTASNKLVMYYTESDTIKKSYGYFINSKVINKIERNFEGSVVGKHVESPMLSGQQTYVQGLAGPKARIKFKNLEMLKDKIINYAALEITLKSGGDIAALVPMQQFMAERKDTSGLFYYIQDVIQTAEHYKTVFGGGLTTKNGDQIYRLNITNHLRKALNDPEFISDVYLNAFNESEEIQRSILYGAEHPEKKMRLKISYTKK